MDFVNRGKTKKLNERGNKGKNVSNKEGIKEKIMVEKMRREEVTLE